MQEEKEEEQEEEVDGLAEGQCLAFDSSTDSHRAKALWRKLQRANKRQLRNSISFVAPTRLACVMEDNETDDNHIHEEVASVPGNKSRVSETRVGLLEAELCGHAFLDQSSEDLAEAIGLSTAKVQLQGEAPSCQPKLSFELDLPRQRIADVPRLALPPHQTLPTHEERAAPSFHLAENTKRSSISMTMSPISSEAAWTQAAAALFDSKQRLVRSHAEQITTRSQHIPKAFAETSQACTEPLELSAFALDVALEQSSMVKESVSPSQDCLNVPVPVLPAASEKKLEVVHSLKTLGQALGVALEFHCGVSPRSVTSPQLNALPARCTGMLEWTLKTLGTHKPGAAPMPPATWRGPYFFEVTTTSEADGRQALRCAELELVVPLLAITAVREDRSDSGGRAFSVRHKAGDGSKVEFAFRAAARAERSAWVEGLIEIIGELRRTAVLPRRSSQRLVNATTN